MVKEPSGVESNLYSDRMRASTGSAEMLITTTRNR